MRDPSRPNATIRYSAVRKETRQFPDYSTVDSSILTDGTDGRGRSAKDGASPGKR